MAAPRPLPPTPPGLLDDEDPGKWERVKQALWETNLNAPVRAVYNLMDTPYDVLMGDSGDAGQQAVADSFDAGAGLAMTGGLLTRPAGSIGMGGRVMLSKGMTKQPEDLVDLFHGTTPDGYQAITSSNEMFGPAYFHPKRSVAEDYAHNVGGDSSTVVRVKIPKGNLKIDLDLPGGKLLTPDEAASYLDKQGWTINDFLEHGYSVGVEDPSSIKFGDD